MTAITLERPRSEQHGAAYYTRQQLAARLAISPQTIANKPEKFPRPYKFGGAVRYSISDTDSWERAHKVAQWN
ncbi:hypothetical protein JNE43_01850 [Kocuria rhizophila]|uniref:helix-turn-helix transcriptional regulator n=1 Tax=Kocuria rhizophila TaxID=72000 RepID=UPI001D92787C|nr:helix-turn-helix domain-containing protein [Kocuria rhizophila]MCC5673579.1 hypothetical protein [Kocuria rhizophila]